MSDTPRQTESDEVAAERARQAEELLFLQARAGDPGARERFARHWHQRLWRHARRVMGNREGADDVLQETWLAVLRGLSRLDDPRAFQAWAYRIVSRAAADRIRRAPREALSDGLDHRAVTEPDDARCLAVLTLRTALTRLEPEDRQLVSLRYLEGLDIHELAAVFDLPEGTVKSRLHRIRRQLRETLEQDEP